jgi:hypothetical protein
MKTTEVPQDKAYFEEGKISDVCYAVDENGQSQQVRSLGWQPKNDALALTWSLIEEKLNDIAQEIEKGKLSPIAYYMHKTAMTPAILAGYTGFFRWAVKRHLKARYFAKLNAEKLSRYAEVFGIEVSALTHFNPTIPPHANSI